MLEKIIQEGIAAMKWLGKGLASLGICAVVGVALIVTKEPMVLWGLVVIVFIWG